MTKNAPFPSQVAEKYVVRFPEGMRDRIAEAAKANNRSMNSEIVARLEESFSPPANNDANTLFALAQLQYNLVEERTKLYQARLFLVEFATTTEDLLAQAEKGIELKRDFVKIFSRQIERALTEHMVALRDLDTLEIDVRRAKQNLLDSYDKASASKHAQDIDRTNL